MEPSILTDWMSPFPIEGVPDVLIHVYFIIMSANSVDPDQTSRSAASDLGPHCLPMSHLRDAGHKWVKLTIVGLALACSDLMTSCLPLVKRTWSESGPHATPYTAVPEKCNHAKSTLI